MTGEIIEPDLCEADYVDDVGFFFRRIGEVAFTREKNVRLAVASKHGVIAVTDGSCRSFRRLI